ncbi:MAG: PSK operon transcription factor [Mesorhizobium amorphae]|nr:MAG: PSK operon transcription factor [Mesorhizobium amorphae]
MGMNIKNPVVEKLADELAALTGKTKTAAIQTALEESLNRRRAEEDVAERRRRLREIVRSFGPVPDGETSDHSDLYDELGLPK